MCRFLPSSIIFICLFNFGISSVIPNTDVTDGLIQVHTIFRHGNRTIEDNIYSGNPYGNESFYESYGYGQLTKIGKQTEYKIGKALRQKYNELLGQKYFQTILSALSTDVQRTKMSMLLVLASLFPPTNEDRWDDELNWQPVPFNATSDKVLSSRQICKKYDKAFKKLINSDEVLQHLESYQEMFEFLSAHTGQTLNKAKKVADLYLELKTQEAYGYPLEEWTYKYMPEMYNITLYTYHLMAYNKKLKKYSSGYFLRKIIEDTQDLILNPSKPIKMYLYSAHEKNLATLLLTLDVFDDMIPKFGSYITFEVHRVTGVYGFKIYYQNYYEEEAVLITIPGCEEFCSLDAFEDLMSPYLPEDSDCELN